MDDARRRLLVGSIFAYCTLDQVTEQIAEYAGGSDRIYVERRGSGYRWSLVHRGGAYPLLREVAKLLDVPYRSLILHFGTIDGWTIALTPEPDAAPDSRGFIEPAAEASINRERILEVTRL